MSIFNTGYSNRLGFVVAGLSALAGLGYVCRDWLKETALPVFMRVVQPRQLTDDSNPFEAEQPAAAAPATQQADGAQTADSDDAHSADTPPSANASGDSTLTDAQQRVLQGFL